MDNTTEVPTNSDLRLRLYLISGEGAREIPLMEEEETGSKIGVIVPAEWPMPPSDHVYAIDPDDPCLLVVDWFDSVTNTAAEHPPSAHGASRYVANEHLQWGDGWIAPGEPVPDHESGRDYAALFAAGSIVHDSPGVRAAIEAREARDGNR